MAANRFWRVKVWEDSGFFGGGNHYLNVSEIDFLDRDLNVVRGTLTSSGHNAKHSPDRAQDGNPETVFCLLTNSIYTNPSSPAWIMMQYDAPVDVAFIAYRGEGANCPKRFSIESSKDGMRWVPGISHTMGRVWERVLFPTGTNIVGPPTLYSMWRLRIIADLGAKIGAEPVMCLRMIKFKNLDHAIVPPLAMFSSPYLAGGAPGTQIIRLYTSGLRLSPPLDCYVAQYSEPFALGGFEFMVASGGTPKQSRGTFAVEGSNNGKDWYTVNTYFNQPMLPESRMIFAT